MNIDNYSVDNLTITSSFNIIDNIILNNTIFNDCYASNLITNNINNSLNNNFYTTYNNFNTITDSLNANNITFNNLNLDTLNINNLSINTILYNTGNTIFNNVSINTNLTIDNINTTYLEQVSPILFNDSMKAQSTNFYYNQDDIIQYDILLDLYNSWNNLTYKYLIIENGKYLINITLTSGDYLLNNSNNLQVKLIHSRDNNIINIKYLQTSQNNSSSEGFYILDCIINDLIWIASINNNSLIYSDNSNNSYGIFQIQLI